MSSPKAWARPGTTTATATAATQSPIGIAQKVKGANAQNSTPQTPVIAARSRLALAVSRSDRRVSGSADYSRGHSTTASDEETIWPPAWAESVYQWSHEIRPGVRRIYNSAVNNLVASALEDSHNANQ
jgi:hypothetical protein